MLMYYFMIPEVTPAWCRLIIPWPAFGIGHFPWWSYLVDMPPHCQQPWMASNTNGRVTAWGENAMRVISTLLTLCAEKPFDRSDLIMQRVCTKEFSWYLTYLMVNSSPLDKMVAISQMTFTNTFFWMKSYGFCFEFHWSLILTVQSTISEFWFR